MLTFVLSALAACANAVSSVLQRKADRDEPATDNLSFRLIIDLFHKPVWFLGILGVIAGFLLQAAALSTGALAVVEPILVFELPVTLLLAGLVFHRRLHRKEWLAALAMTFGLAALLYALAPSPAGSAHPVRWYVWATGIAANAGIILALVLAAHKSRGGASRAALLGTAGGASFGLTAALMKAMTNALNRGFGSIFLTWQTYAMVVAGAGAMFLLQSALNAGSLVAAQPGLTTTDPVVSILWGTLAFGETVRGGWYLAIAVAAAAAIGWGVFQLSRSPLVAAGDGDGGPNGSGELAERS